MNTSCDPAKAGCAAHASRQLAHAVRLFRRAEHAIALLERTIPANHAEESRALLEDWTRGNRRAPRWRYGPPPALGELRRALDATAARLAGEGPLAALHAERARELACEAQIVEHVGTPDFKQWASRRFPVDGGSDGSRALAWATAWAVAATEPAGPFFASDDESEPASLVTVMRRTVGRLRLPVRVVVKRDLAAAAATGDGVVVVRAGLRLTDADARRVVFHEIYGHALPRARSAREALGLFAVASAAGSDDEEGRALLLERREGLLGRARRADLGRRHLAALSVRAGADWVDTAALALELGAEMTGAVALATRVHRGGGLARELVYLPALSRVERALREDPDLEAYMERGRVSAAAAAALRDLGERSRPDLGVRAA